MFVLAALLAGAAAPQHVPAKAVPERAAQPTTSRDQPPPDVAQAAGPRGTSGDQHYDAVGYAAVGGAAEPGVIAIASNVLPPGSFVELTALDTGRTIIASVTTRTTSGATVADLSPGAAHALGVAGERVAVRIRPIVPSAQDEGALRAKQAASPRSDAPAGLLVALRKRLPIVAVAPPPPPLVTPEKHISAAAAKPAPRHAVQPGASYSTPGDRQGDAKGPTSVKPSQPSPAPQRPVSAKPAPEKPAPEKKAGPGWYVQVAALSSSARAAVLASSLGAGRVVSAGKVHRVQLGPYGSAAAAHQARDAVARRGYGDARVIQTTQ
ncbi:MAG: SPOR domain-containing protein [Sphingomonas sp.]